MSSDAPPRRKDTQMLCAEIRGHADEIAQVSDLRLTNFRGRAAKVVVGGYCVNLDSFALGDRAQVLAAARRPIQWISMRTFAVNLDPVIAKSPGSFDQFRQGQWFTSIPEAKIRDAIESEFHFDKGCFWAAHRMALRKIVVKA